MKRLLYVRTATMAAALSMSIVPAFSDDVQAGAASQIRRGRPALPGPEASIKMQSYASSPREAAAKNPDTSGNGTLTGIYFIRQILLTGRDTSGHPKRARSASGPVTFDGKGNYSFAGFLMDTQVGGPAQQYGTSGTYGVSSSGTMYITSIIDNTDTDFGGVGAAGPSAFVASATEGGNVDILVGIPVTAHTTLANLSGTYQAVYIDYLQGDVTKLRNASFRMMPNGQGGIPIAPITGYISDSQFSAVQNQSLQASYSVASNPGPFGSFNFGPANTSQLISGNKPFAVSPDGNLVLATDTGGFDLLFASRAFSGSNPVQNYIGVYYYATLSSDNTHIQDAQSSTSGSINATGTGISLTHQRLFQVEAFQPAYDNTYDTTGLMFDSSGAVPGGLGNEFLGAGGLTFFGSGTNGFYSMFIGLQAKPFTPSGVYIYPTAVTNAASFQPITNAIAPGEYLTIFGSGLAPGTFPRPGESLPIPLPTSLGGVQVTVNGRLAPMFFVSPGQISFIAPSATGGTASNPEPYANFQVINNNAKSNVVSVRTGVTSPGVWTSGADGISIARVQKLPDFSLVSPSNPIRPGDSLVIYCTGLGSVTPPVADGNVALVNPLSMVDAVVFVYIDGQGQRPLFAGLTPGFANLYQLNVTVPKAITRGTNVLLDIETDTHDANLDITAYNSQALLPVAPIAGNVFMTFTPNPVTAGSDGKWHYIATLQENGGSAVTIKTMVVNGTDSSSNIVPFFGSTRIPANGKLAASLVSSNFTPPNKTVFVFTGVDSLGNAVNWSGTVNFQ